MTFHARQKVVCIVDATKWQAFNGETVPRKGGVYTVRDVTVEEEGCFLWLVEIVNRPMRYMNGLGECNFQAEGFRPVIDRKTDISIFTAMLGPAPKVRVPDEVSS